MLVSWRMKIARYEVLSLGNVGELNKTRYGAKKALEWRYGLSPEAAPYVDDALSQLKPILAAANGGLEGKVVLDLGCGSEYSQDAPTSEMNRAKWHPWLSRALHYLGHKVIGIDLAYLGNEPFKNIQADLSQEGALDGIESDSIDIANAHYLFDSPTLGRLCKGMELADLLVPQLKRVVKNGGTFLYHTDSMSFRIPA